MSDEWTTGIHFIIFTLTGGVGMIFIFGCLGYLDKKE